MNSRAGGQLKSSPKRLSFFFMSIMDLFEKSANSAPDAGMWADAVRALWREDEKGAGVFRFAWFCGGSSSDSGEQREEQRGGGLALETPWPAVMGGHSRSLPVPSTKRPNQIPTETSAENCPAYPANVAEKRCRTYRRIPWGAVFMSNGDRPMKERSPRSKWMNWMNNGGVRESHPKTGTASQSSERAANVANLQPDSGAAPCFVA